MWLKASLKGNLSVFRVRACVLARGGDPRSLGDFEPFGAFAHVIVHGTEYITFDTLLKVVVYNINNVSDTLLDYDA